MTRALRSVLFLALLCAVAAAPELRAGTPGRVRVAVGPEGTVLGGCPAPAGDGDEFALFRWDADGGPAKSLGVFNGRLAGLAVSPEDGRVFALTRDGALGVYGDDPQSLSLADDRWNMLDLALYRGEALALHYENGELRLARPDGNRSWNLSETPFVRDRGVTQASFALAGDRLHLLWSANARDLSRGALRHLAFDGSEWVELPPLALGDVAAFTLFPVADGLDAVALVPDLLDAGEPRLAMGSWRNGSWSIRPPGLPENLLKNLAGADDFAAAGRPGGGRLWLTAGPGGVTAFPERPGTGAAEGGPVVLLKREDPTARAGLFSLALLASFLALVALYCRRSRMLSRLYPGRPADLVSRGAALAADWLLVSVGLGAYHIAAGDVRIVEELLTLESANRLFWINLGAFSLYAALTEGFFGRTPGKHLAGMRVRCLYGGPPGAFRAFLRNLLRVIDMFPLPIGVPGLLGLLAALWNPRRQRVGDMVAATVVRRHVPLRQREFVLASASPRRRELMEALGLPLRVQATDTDEDAIQGTNPEETAMLRAQVKASTVAGGLETPREVVIGADTMVVLDGEILGKPANREEAERMLERLSGRSHTVVTGLAVIDTATGQRLSDVETTEVEFRALSRPEIESYVATGDPMDKAGAYGVQSADLVRQIRGSLSNVAGLPMEKLRWVLAALDS